MTVSREELVEALRQIVADRDETEAQFAGLPIPIRNSSIEAARQLIRRVDQEQADAVERAIRTGMRLYPDKLSQEGGDAADTGHARLVSGERSEGLHVAPPAPTCLPERATILINRILSARLRVENAKPANGCRDKAVAEYECARNELMEFLNCLFAAGERSGIEEAAKALHERAALATTFVETATFGLAASTVRALLTTTVQP